MADANQEIFVTEASQGSTERPRTSLRTNASAFIVARHPFFPSGGSSELISQEELPLSPAMKKLHLQSIEGQIELTRRIMKQILLTAENRKIDNYSLKLFFITEVQVDV